MKLVNVSEQTGKNWSRGTTGLHSTLKRAVLKQIVQTALVTFYNVFCSGVTRIL